MTLQCGLVWYLQYGVLLQVETTKVLLKENGVNLMLTVVDTPGFGDAVDNSDWSVQAYITE